MAKGIDNYVTDQLDYYSRQLGHSSVNGYTIKTGIEILKELAQLTKTGKQAALHNKLTAKTARYETRFAKVLAYMAQ